MKFHVWILIKKYEGESFHSFIKGICEHIRDLKRRNINTSLVNPNLETNNNFNLKNSKMLVYIHNKKSFKKFLNLVSFQTIILSNKDSFFFNLSSCLVSIGLKSYKIPHLK